MATHSSVLAWITLGTGEHGGLPSMGSHSRTRDLAVALCMLYVILHDLKIQEVIPDLNTFLYKFTRLPRWPSGKTNLPAKQEMQV